MQYLKYLGTKELAQLLGVPVNTIYYWIHKKKIPVIKMGKHNRFNYEDVLEFFKRSKDKK